MAEIYYSIKLSTLTEIGDAIRAKSGATGDIAVTSLATSILDLSPADDVIEWDGSGVVIAPIESEQPMTFTINGTSYQMDNQMTWYAWTRSDYNTDGFSCAEENDYVYEAESSNKVTDADGNDVLGTTYIVEGGAYLIKEATTTDELAGTWFLNSTLTESTDITNYMSFQMSGTYSGSFPDTGVLTDGLVIEYVSLRSFDPFYGVFGITGTDDYYASDFESYEPIGSHYYYTSDGNLFVNCRYQDGRYNYYSVGSIDGIKARTFTITSKLSEVTNGEVLLTWLKANATKQGDTNEGATND